MGPIADDEQADGHAARRRCRRANHHVPALLSRKAADSEQQDRIRPKPKRSESGGTKISRPQRRRKKPGLDPHRHGFHAANPAVAQTVRELAVGADDSIEQAAETAQMAPEPPEPAVDRVDRSDAAEPPISVSGKRIRMHDQ